MPGDLSPVWWNHPTLGELARAVWGRSGINTTLLRCTGGFRGWVCPELDTFNDCREMVVSSTTAALCRVIYDVFDGTTQNWKTFQLLFGGSGVKPLVLWCTGGFSGSFRYEGFQGVCPELGTHHCCWETVFMTCLMDSYFFPLDGGKSTLAVPDILPLNPSVRWYCDVRGVPRMVCVCPE